MPVYERPNHSWAIRCDSCNRIIGNFSSREAATTHAMHTRWLLEASTAVCYPCQRFKPAPRPKRRGAS